MTSYLEFRALTKHYGSTTALREVTLAVDEGQILALLGPNGAGKSTLFGCLLGFTHPTKGEILLRERLLADTDRLAFGYTAERVSLYPERTVADNAAFFAELKGVSHHEVDRQIVRVGLKGVQDRRVRQLSKGMLQRLGLAIALCGEPQLLVLDEPFNGLDPALLERLQSILCEERDRGATLLISTHTMSAIESIASHVAVLLQGRLVANGTLDSLRAEYSDAGSLESIYHRIACREEQPAEAIT